MKSAQILQWLFFLLLAGSLILLDQRQILRGPKSWIQAGLTPFEAAGFAVQNNVSDLISTLTFWHGGEARIRNLEQRNAELTYKIARLNDLTAENKDLRFQLGAKDQDERKLFPAKVLGRGRYLIIESGAKDGIKAGQNVIYGGNLVGIIKSSGERTSFVQMPTDALSKIPIKTGASQLTRGLVNGQFNSAMILDQIAQNEDANINDVVLTTGEDQIYQADLVVGKITKITSEPTDLFKRGEVSPLINFKDLTTVFVLLE